MDKKNQTCALTKKNCVHEFLHKICRDSCKPTQRLNVWATWKLRRRRICGLPLFLLPNMSRRSRRLAGEGLSQPHRLLGWIPADWRMAQFAARRNLQQACAVFPPILGCAGAGACLPADEWQQVRWRDRWVLISFWIWECEKGWTSWSD